MATAEVDENMMNMRAIGLEGGFAPHGPKAKDPERIKKGNNQDGDSYGWHRFYIIMFMRQLIAFDKRNGQNREGEAQQKRARIAHKNLGGTSIVIKESGQRAQHSKGQNGQIESAKLIEPKAQGSAANDANRGGQSIDAINEIEGIDNDQHTEDRKRGRQGIGNIIDPKNTVKTAEINARLEDQNTGGHNLAQKLFDRAERDNIILGPNQENDDIGAKDILYVAVGRIGGTIKGNPEGN